MLGPGNAKAAAAAPQTAAAAAAAATAARAPPPGFGGGAAGAPSSSAAATAAAEQGFANMSINAPISPAPAAAGAAATAQPPRAASASSATPPRILGYAPEPWELPGGPLPGAKGTTPAQDTTTTKPTVHLVVLGHVDAGKSTTMGRLLHEVGAVGTKESNKNARDAAAAGKGSFSWAWNLDSRPEERARGVTVDVSVARFETPQLRVTLLDAPGCAALLYPLYPPGTPPSGYLHLSVFAKKSAAVRFSGAAAGN